MKTVDEIKVQIDDIKNKLNSEAFKKLNEQEQALIKAINDSCIATLEWVISE